MTTQLLISGHSDSVSVISGTDHNVQIITNPPKPGIPFLILNKTPFPDEELKRVVTDDYGEALTYLTFGNPTSSPVSMSILAFEDTWLWPESGDSNLVVVNVSPEGAGDSKTASQITINVNKNTFFYGETITISGVLESAILPNFDINSATVGLMIYNNTTGTMYAPSVITSPGLFTNYEYKFTSDEVGHYDVTASFSGNNDYDFSSSATVKFTIQSKPSSGCSPSCSSGKHCDNGTCVPDRILSDDVKKQNAAYWNTLSASQKDAQRAAWLSVGYTVCEATGIYECEVAPKLMSCAAYKTQKSIGAVPTKSQVLQAQTDYNAGIIDKACVIAIDDAYMAGGNNLISCEEFRTAHGIGTTATIEQVQMAQSSQAAGIIDGACLAEITALPRTPTPNGESNAMLAVGAGIAVIGFGYLLTRKRRQ